MKQWLDFKKKRDLGEVIRDTFRFLGQEFRPLGTVIIYYALPFILISAISIMLFFERFRPFFTNPEAIVPSGFMKDILMFYLFMIVIFAVSKVMFISTVNNYIALYVEKGKGNFNAADVSHRISSTFWQMLFTGILVGLMTFFGVLFCILPGIYLAISLSMIYIALAYEKKGFGDALSRTFELSSMQWWWTFLLLLVIEVIMFIVILIPYFIFFSLNFTSLISMGPAPDPEKLAGFMKNYSVLGAISMVISSLLQVLVYVSMAFQYFNLVAVRERESNDLLR